MKNTCPECDTAYNVANAPVGRKFTCKKCGTPVVVTEDGLDYQNPPAKAPPAAPAPAPAPAPAGGAFEFDDAPDDAPKPPKGVKGKSKGRPRDEEEEPEDEAPRKPKKKPARARDDDEPADDDEAERPARRGRAKPRGDERNPIADLISFAGPTAPSFIKLLFFAFAGAVLFSALLTLVSLFMSEKVPTEYVLRALAAELLTVAAALFVGRVLAELAVVGFAALARFTELKAELEKANAVLANPPTPPALAQPAGPAVVLAAAPPAAPPADGPLV